MIPGRDTEVEALLKQQARKAWSAFKQDAEYPDVLQELHAWWLNTGHQLAAEAAEAAAYRAAREYCLYEKAQRGGYEPEDQFRYTRSMVEQLVDVALAWPDLPGNEVDDSPRAKGPVGEGGNLPALVADVKRALAQLEQDDAWLIHAVACGSEWPVVATQRAMDERAARRWYTKVLDLMCGFLNGDSA